MNKYREKLCKLRELIYFGNKPDAIKLIDELLNDDDLLLVNKNCLPLKYEKYEEYFTYPLPRSKVKYEVGLHLTNCKTFETTYNSSLPKDFDERVAIDLRKMFYEYLENQDYPYPFKEFEIIRYEDGRLAINGK